jgi:hypothetical protein
VPKDEYNNIKNEINLLSFVFHTSKDVVEKEKAWNTLRMINEKYVLPPELKTIVDSIIKGAYTNP